MAAVAPRHRRRHRLASRAKAQALVSVQETESPLSPVARADATAAGKGGYPGDAGTHIDACARDYCVVGDDTWSGLQETLFGSLAPPAPSPPPALAEKSVGPPPPPGGVFEIVLLDVKPSELGTAADYSAEYLNAVTPENAHVSVAHVEAIEDAEAKAMLEELPASRVTEFLARRGLRRDLRRKKLKLLKQCRSDAWPGLLAP